MLKEIQKNEDKSKEYYFAINNPSKSSPKLQLPSMDQGRIFYGKDTIHLEAQ